MNKFNKIITASLIIIFLSLYVSYLKNIEIRKNQVEIINALYYSGILEYNGEGTEVIINELVRVKDVNISE